MAKFQAIYNKAVEFYQKTLVWMLKNKVGGKMLAVMSVLLIAAAGVVAGWTAIYAFIMVLAVMASSKAMAGIVLILISGTAAYLLMEYLFDSFQSDIVSFWKGEGTCSTVIS